MKQTLNSFTIDPLTGAGTATTARLVADVPFQASTGEVHPAGDDKTNYTEFILTASGNGMEFPTSVIDTTDDSPDNPNATYTLYLMNGNKQVGVVFERWAFKASLGASVTYTELSGANVHKVPLRDDQSYSKTQIDVLIQGRTFSTPATTTDLGIVTVSKVGGTEVWSTDDSTLGYYASNYSTLALAVAVIGSTRATLIISADMTISASLVIPPTTDLRFINGAKLTIASGQTLTVNGLIFAGHHQIFAGSGTIVLSRNACAMGVSAAWAGATHTTSNASDSTAAIQKIIDSVPNGSIILHPPGWIFSLRSKLKINNRVNLTYTGCIGESPSAYAGFSAGFAWNGAANGIMLEMINSSSCLIKGINFDMVGSTPANAAAFGIFTSADYTVTLTGVETNTGSPTVAFTGMQNGSLVNSLPNGDLVHQGRPIVIGANTYTILNIVDGVGAGSLTLTTNALANVSGGTATIANPYGSSSSTSHKFIDLCFNWSTATTTVAYRTAICNDLYSGQNHERIICRGIVVYGHGGASATTSSDYGVGISFGGFYDSGSVDAISPYTGYNGGSNVLECELEDCFIYGTSFPVHGMAGTITRLQGTYANCVLFGSVVGTFTDIRYEAYRQFLHGFGNITLNTPRMTTAYTGFAQFEVYGGSSRLTVRNALRHMGGLYDGTGIVTFQCTSPTVCEGEFSNNDFVDATDITTQRPVGFQDYSFHNVNVVEYVSGYSRRTKIVNAVAFADLATVAANFGGLLDAVTGTTVIEILCTGVTAGSDPATSGATINPVLYIQTAAGGRWKAY
jgi:hypothetical protein